MNYELALTLKNAGFPQKTGRVVFADAYVDHEGNLITTPDEAAYPPTLEELIDACGEVFSELRSQNRPDGKWRAYANVGHKEASGQERTRGLGSTPTEAVARLWLELNKK